MQNRYQGKDDFYAAATGQDGGRLDAGDCQTLQIILARLADMRAAGWTAEEIELAVINWPEEWHGMIGWQRS